MPTSTSTAASGRCQDEADDARPRCLKATYYSSGWGDTGGLGVAGVIFGNPVRQPRSAALVGREWEEQKQHRDQNWGSR